jgi:hypothetical protein
LLPIEWRFVSFCQQGAALSL